MIDSDYDEGSVYFISKGRDGQVLGQPTYASVLDITATLVMAVVCIPAPNVFSALEECALKRVKLVAIVTAGYSGAADQGKKDENSSLTWLKSMMCVLPGPIAWEFSMPALPVKKAPAFFEGAG